jgi:hypothetical protein
MPQVLTPGDGAIGSGVKGLVYPISHRIRKRDENEWKEDEGSDEKASPPESEEEEEDEERDPSDTGIGEEERRHEKDEVTQDDESTLTGFGVDDCVESSEGDEGEEEETVDIRVTKGAKDAGDGHVFILEANTTDKLVESEENREKARKKNSVEKRTEITVPGGRDIGKKADDKEIEETQEFGSGGCGADRVGERHASPDCDDEKWCEEREAPEPVKVAYDGNDTEACDAEAEELGEREGNIEQREADVLR